VNPLPPTVVQAFRVAAGELGLCSASWLFAREAAAEGGDALVESLRDLLGREYPVVDAVAQQWMQGARGPATDPTAVLEACAGARRVLVIGLETELLDALVPRLAPTRTVLLAHGPGNVDYERVASNYGDLLELTDMASFQKLSGSSSVLLTFLYGVRGGTTAVDPAWVRVNGPDVRVQFRSIVGWDVLRTPMYVYPRWLVEVPVTDFSNLLAPGWEPRSSSR